MKLLLQLVSSLFVFQLVNCDPDVILHSPNITNYGSWGTFDNCTEGKLVTGFQIKVEPKHSLVDDTGLNGIRFFCGRYSSEDAEHEAEWENVTSRIGSFGNWGKIYNCSTYAVGFNLEVQSVQGKYKDDVGATNLKIICGDSREIEGFIHNGNGHDFTDTAYSGPQTCPFGMALCGIQTQVERYQGPGDDTALNNLNAKCCKTSLNDVIG